MTTFGLVSATRNTRDTRGLRDRTTGTVRITTSSAESALTVPTSAVHVDNGRYSVTVVDGLKTEAVTVDVGAMGSTWTAFTR